MASLDNSIFRKRAVEKHIYKRERHVVLRLVSPPMFVFLWALLLLSVGAGALVWTIQEPILIQGKGVVVEQKASDGKTTQKVFVLLILSPDQRANLKVGQPVRITIASANINFNSSIDQVEKDVMSPSAVSAMYNAQTAPLAQTLTGPSLVATAPVEPMSLAQTYLGSQCQVQVQIGSQSALSVVPGFNNVPQILNMISQQWHNLSTIVTQQWHSFFRK